MDERGAADLGLQIMLFQPFRDFEGVSPARLVRNLERARRKFELMHELGTDRVLVPALLGLRPPKGTEGAA